VVAKGVVSPRPAYAPIAAETILVDTPGVTSADLSSFPYRRRRRPIYPFERGRPLSDGGSLKGSRVGDGVARIDVRRAS
jgi:microcystin degradation protein MlrC